MVSQSKKPVTKKLKKHSFAEPSSHELEVSDFLPLEGGPGRKLPEGGAPKEDTATVLYIGRIPHGFYEEQMEGFFQQFGKVRRLKIIRNKKTGKSKHYGFLEFENPEVAKIVASEMNNYKLMEHLLQVRLVPPERVNPKLWKGANRGFKLINWTEIARKQHNKVRTIEEHTKLVGRIRQRDKKRQQKIQAAGMEYKCPEFVGILPSAPKKIKFEDEEE